MNYKHYEKLLSNIEHQAPHESGVQTLVYMLLDEVFENSNYNVLVINDFDYKTQFATYGGISDLAIVEDSFSYDSNADDHNGICFCVEIKNTTEKLSDYEKQILFQILSFKKGIITNGYEWKFYDLTEFFGKKSDNSMEEVWLNADLQELQEEAQRTVSLLRDLAKRKSSYAHAKDSDYKKNLEEEIRKLEKELEPHEEKMNNLQLNIQWISDAIDEPWKTVDLKSLDGGIDKTKFIELLQILYEMVQKL